MKRSNVIVIVVLLAVLLVFVGVAIALLRPNALARALRGRSVKPVIVSQVDEPEGRIFLSRFLNGDDDYREDAINDIYSSVWKADKFFTDARTLKLCRAIQSRNPQKVRKLIQSGYKPETLNTGVMPLLFWSFFCGEDVFKELLDGGANQNAILLFDYDVVCDSIIKDSSLLYVALMWSNYHIEDRSFFKNYPRLLLEHGASAKEIGEESPLLLALRLRNPTAEAGEYLDLDTIKLLVSHDANVNFTSRNGKYNPVSTAAQKFDFTALEVLLEHGATVDTSTFPGRECQRALYYYREKILNSPLYDADVRRVQNEAFNRVVALLEKQGVTFDAPEAIQSDWEREQACAITRRAMPEEFPVESPVERETPERQTQKLGNKRSVTSDATHEELDEGRADN